MKSGGKILVDQLIINGIESIFCVPGESYLEVLDALYDVRDKISVFNARHEGGAANMAEAAGKLTGKPGVAIVTRGPGACHASIGVHIASQDSTPMILIIGQVEQSSKDRRAFQEINYEAMFGKVAKWCAQIESVERIPEYISRAITVSLSGKPGPVVLSIPENIFRAKADCNLRAVTAIEKPAPFPESVEKLKNLIIESKKPFILIGGSSWDESSGNLITAFAMRFSIPIATSFRRQDIIDNESPIFCGSFGTSVSPQLAKRIKEADLIIVLGAQLGEMTTNGYELIKPLHPIQTLVHVHVDPCEIGIVFQPNVGIVSGMFQISSELLNLELEKKDCWSKWCKKLCEDYSSDIIPPPYAGDLDLGKIFKALDKELPENSIVTLDAGNHTGWPQRFLKYGPKRRQIGSTCGAMGYAIPAAVSASILFPTRFVLGIVGDGGFVMSGFELMTAVQYQAAPVIVVFNNSSYGTIRMHQEREHPGRVMATDIVNPSFEGIGKSMGVHSELVTKTEQFLPAFNRCLIQNGPSLIELITDKQQLSTRHSLYDLITKS